MSDYNRMTDQHRQDQIDAVGPYLAAVRQLNVRLSHLTVRGWEVEARLVMAEDPPHALRLETISITRKIISDLTEGR